MHPRYLAAVAALAPALREALLPRLDAADFAARFTAAEWRELCQHSGLASIPLAFALLPLAAACAVTPVSRFAVGAVALGQSGAVYLGANSEMAGAALNHTLHAEQSAVANAWLAGEPAITDLVVTHPPCGHCRQFLNELRGAAVLRIHLPSCAAAPLPQYLPAAFGPASLAIAERLLDQQDHGFTVCGDALSQAAIRAANASYAPYSRAFSGVALETDDQRIFSGRYAENAAFNPSLPPLHCALNALNLAGYPIDRIRRIAFAEQAEALITMQSLCRTLPALDGIAWESVTLRR